MFRRAARKFAETKVAPKVAEIVETREVSDEMPILEGMMTKSYQAIYNQWQADPIGF